MKLSYFRVARQMFRAKLLLWKLRLLGFNVSRETFRLGKQCLIHLLAKESSLKIGAKCILMPFNKITVELKGKLTIGRQVFINSFGSITCLDEVTIGEHCSLGEGVRIYDHNHVFKDLSMPVSQQGFRTAPVRIGKNCWLGANVIVLKGVTIGDSCIIAAGTVVSEDIPANMIARNEGSGKLSFTPRH